MSKKKQRSITRIELFGERDKNHPRNETYEGIEHFTGLSPDRVATDKWFIIPFALPNIVLLALIYPDINRLSYPWDFRADVCGKAGTNLQELKYLYFFDPVNVPGIGYCVYECPNQENIETCFYDVDGATQLNDYCYMTMETFTYNRFCIPSQGGAEATAVWNYVMSEWYLTTRAAYDIYMSSDIQAICVFIMGMLGLIFTGLMLIPRAYKYFFKFFLYMPILFTGWIGWVIFSDTQNYFNKVCPGGSDNGCAGFRYLLLRAVNVLVVLAVITIYVTLFLQRKRIKSIRDNLVSLTRPISKLKSASLTLENLPAMLGFGIVLFFVEMIIIGGLVAYFVILMGSGKVTVTQAPPSFPSTEYVTWDASSYVGPLYPIIVIMGLWWLYVFQLFQRCVISATTSCWFFAREKTIIHLPLLQGLKNTLKYHMGSVIKASLLIPFAAPINAVMDMVRVKLKKMNRGTKQFKFWMGTCTPPLIFFEHVIKYIDDRPLAQISVFGDPYYYNCVRMFYLWYRNDSRIKEVKNMVGLINAIAKFFILLLCCTICYFWISFIDKSPAGLYFGVFEFPIVPPFLMFLYGIFACESLSNTIDLVIDSLFFAFTIDEEMYFGRQRHAELDLIEFMDLYGKEAVRANDLEVRARGGRDGHQEEEIEIKADQRATVQLGSEETDRKMDESHDSDGDHSDHDDKKEEKKEEKKKVGFAGLHFDNLSVDASQEIPEDSKEDDVSDVVTHKEQTPAVDTKKLFFNAIDLDGIQDNVAKGGILSALDESRSEHEAADKPLMLNKKPMDRNKVNEMLKEKQALKGSDISGVFDKVADLSGLPTPKTPAVKDDKMKVVNASVDFSDAGGLTIHKDPTNKSGISDMNNSAAKDINVKLFDGMNKLARIRDAANSDSEDEEDLEATNKNNIKKSSDFNF